MENYDSWKKKILRESGQSYIYLIKNPNNPDEKLILKKLKNPKRLDRFEREIKTINSLNHKNIIKIIGYDLTCEKPYYVTEYYENGSLENLDLNNYNLSKKLFLFKKICISACILNKNKIIHRDLKPDNIFLNNDFEPILGDFGLAYIEDEERITKTEEVVGSRYYLPPEFEGGRQNTITFASDVYSLGKILYWIITGKHLPRENFKENTEYSLIKYINEREANLLEEFFNKTITENAKDRIQNGEELIKELHVLIRKIEHNCNKIGKNIPQYCIYCGNGKYKKIRSKDNKKFLLICEYCGNVQKFTKENIKENIWDFTDKIIFEDDEILNEKIDKRMQQLVDEFAEFLIS